MKPRKTESGFSLAEVTLAVGVAGFCLVAIFGLLPVGLNSNAVAIEQTRALSVVGDVAADLRNTPRPSSANPAPKSPRYQVDLLRTGTTSLYLSGEGIAVSQPEDARYLVLVSLPQLPAGRAATCLNVKASWPAVALPTKAAGSVETFLALDRN